MGSSRGSSIIYKHTNIHAHTVDCDKIIIIIIISPSIVCMCVFVKLILFVCYVVHSVANYGLCTFDSVDRFRLMKISSVGQSAAFRSNALAHTTCSVNTSPTGQRLPLTRPMPAPLYHLPTGSGSAVFLLTCCIVCMRVRACLCMRACIPVCVRALCM